MERQVLSIAQMQKLKELGVDTNKASIYWMVQTNGIRIGENTNLRKPYLGLHKESVIIGFNSYDVIPTFTLQDVIELMPTTIGDYSLGIYPWRPMIVYHRTDWSENLENLNGLCIYGNPKSSLLDLAFKMLCFLAEKGYLK